MGIELTGEEKFEKCRYRSLEKYSSSIGLPCCGAKVEEHFQCFIHVNINVVPSVCEVCRAYKPKLIKENAS